MNLSKRQEYVKMYYELYDDGSIITHIDNDTKFVADLLIKYAKGKVLDCGCGTVPQMWSIFMPQSKLIYAIDLPKESIEFVKNKIKMVDEWKQRFELYAEYGNTEISKQISKLNTIQSDMTDKLPFQKSFFDTALSLYSLGTLPSENDLNKAISNISDVLKINGTFIHVNTNGYNSNEIVPEYTWRGLEQTTDIIKKYLQKNGFDIIETNSMKVDGSSMYKYDEIHSILAIKKS